MNGQRALIVDDEPDIRELVEVTLNRMGVDTNTAADLAGARARLDEGEWDLCLTDMRLPDGSGIDLVSEIARDHPMVPVAVITAYGSMESAVSALKAGAFDFVSKPLDLDDLRRLVDHALRLRPRTPADNDEQERDLFGRSDAIERLRRQIAKVSRSQAPVAISGESGTGKERVARLIHSQGPRSDRPFVPVNCGAIPRELMESEFFGYRRGAFTGAVGEKDGLFVAAEGGTLFLDEVAELPAEMQVKLLRVIQEKRVRPLGATKELPVDVRILSASHRDLETEMRAGRFREDLFYRINVIALHVPPLRQRREDIPLLTEQLLARLAAGYGCEAPTLTPAARKALAEYGFPGNVRELENILERALALADGEHIDVEDLALPQESPPDIAEPGEEPAREPVTAGSLDDMLETRQREMLCAVLERHRWNRTTAAQELGLTYRQLRYRLKKLGID